MRIADKAKDFKNIVRQMTVRVPFEKADVIGKAQRRGANSMAEKGTENCRYSTNEKDTNLVCGELLDPVPIIPGFRVLPITNTPEIIK